MTSAIATNFQSTAEYNAWYDMSKNELIDAIYEIINEIMGEWEKTNHRSGAFQDAIKWLATTDEDDWGITAETTIDKFGVKYAQEYQNNEGKNAWATEKKYLARFVSGIMKKTTKIPHSVIKKYISLL